MEEIWKDIEGYEGLYQVSNQGRVRSLDRCVNHGGRSNKGLSLKKGKILSQGKDGNGYPSVMLSKNSKTKRRHVYRFVAELFVPNPYNLPEVNHKDENKMNSCADNLEWCTRSYNNSYNGLAKKKGKMRKKPIIQMDMDGNELVYWFSATDCQEETGWFVSNILNVCHGKAKSAYNHMWKFA